MGGTMARRRQRETKLSQELKQKNVNTEISEKLTPPKVALKKKG